MSKIVFSIFILVMVVSCRKSQEQPILASASRLQESVENLCGILPERVHNDPQAMQRSIELIHNAFIKANLNV